MPVKFRLKDYAGNIASAAVMPRWIIPQKGGLISAKIEATGDAKLPASENNFRYDADAGQYIYNWSAKNLPAGYFWTIGAVLDDGTTRTVDVGLK